jgi:hypothetical protein
MPPSFIDSNEAGQDGAKQSAYDSALMALVECSDQQPLKAFVKLGAIARGGCYADFLSVKSGPTCSLFVVLLA